MPTTLNNKISRLSRKAQEVDDAQRRALLMKYRRHVESLNDSAEYPQFRWSGSAAQSQRSAWQLHAT